MKYIMLKTQMGNNVCMFEPTIFSEILSHYDMAESLLDRYGRGDWVVHSAGFYKNGECYGESDSLGLRSDPKDSERIRFAVAGEVVID